MSNVRELMRRLLLIVLLTPSLSYAVGQEECWYEGKVGNKKIFLTYQDLVPYDAAWRNSKYRGYNYCNQSENQNEILLTTSPSNDEVFLLCYESYPLKTKPTTVYKFTEKISKKGKLEQYYICKSGCGTNVSKKLTMGCVSE